jgi:hypothetical protein
MNNCPCCSSTLLRHVRHSQIYWYCPHCKQEMPNLGDWINNQAFSHRIKNSSDHASKPVFSTSIKSYLSEFESVPSLRV